MSCHHSFLPRKRFCDVILRVKSRLPSECVPKKLNEVSFRIVSKVFSHTTQWASMLESPYTPLPLTTTSTLVWVFYGQYGKWLSDQGFPTLLAAGTLSEYLPGSDLDYRNGLKVVVLQVANSSGEVCYPTQKRLGR